jgi:hypothetical protein
MKKLIFITLSVVLINTMCSLSFASFRKGPYLQNVTKTSITICWQTDGSTTGTVYYGIGNTNLSETDNTVTNFHEVTLNGLTSETEYQYYVTDGEDTSSTNTFSTAVSPGTDFIFVAYGDNQPINTTTTAHEEVVSKIESLSPMFVVNAGDMWQTNKSNHVQTFFDVESDLLKNITLFPARGNHEYIKLARNPDRFEQYLSLPANLVADDADAYYSFDYGNSHFLFINTEPKVGYGTASAQYAAITTDLDSADANTDIKHIFVVMHRAAHSNGTRHGSSENRNLSSVLGPLFVEHNVDTVFQGHDHMYERFHPEGTDGPLTLSGTHSVAYPDRITEGVTYVVTGGGGSSLHNVPSAPTTEINATPNLTSRIAKKTYEVMQVDVYGNEVQVTVYCVNEDINGNGILDSGEDCDGNGILDTDGSATLDKFTIDKSSDTPSCPSLYYWNGTDFERSDFFFPGAIPRENEYTDHIPLGQLMLKDDKYVLQIRETEEEKSFIDMTKLIIVDHEADVDIRKIFLERNSLPDPHVRTYEMWYNSSTGLEVLKQNSKMRTLTPVSAIHSVLKNVESLLETSDDIYVQMNQGETLELTFPYLPLDDEVRDIIFVAEGYYVPLTP